MPGTMYLPFYYLKELKYSSGFNYPFLDSPLSFDPPHAYILGLSTSYFSSNFNLMSILYFIPLIMLIIYLCKFRTEENFVKSYILNNKIDKTFDKCLYVMLFNFIFLVNSSMMFFKFGDTTDTASWALSIVFLVYSLVMMLLLRVFFSCSYRFRKLFKI